MQFFFSDTLDISSRFVDRALSSIADTGVQQKDGRGRHTNRPTKVSDTARAEIRDHINSFPRVDSHYCRRDSRKEYLEGNLTITKMYQDYVAKVTSPESSKAPASKYIYTQELDQMNIAFHKPKKDLCDLCTSFSNTPQTERSEEMKTEFADHQTNKELARENKDSDKEKAQNGDIDAACFDLEQILQTPHVENSCAYYKRKLSTFNFTVYHLGTKAVKCYIWNECTAGRGSDEVASCVFDFLSSMTHPEVVLYSDNCGGQNRNRFFVTMLWYAVQVLQITKIQHTFLEKGHTHNENDSVHSAVEFAGRNIPVYTTQQWAAVVRGARRKGDAYEVTEMDSTKFLDFKALAERYIKNFTVDDCGNRVKWIKIRVICVNKLEPNKIYFKYSYDEEFLTFDLHRRQRNINLNSFISAPTLHPVTGVSKEKYDDLMYFVTKNIIPPVYHEFFKKLHIKGQDVDTAIVSDPDSDTE